MTKHNQSEEQFTPLSAEATSITTMGINEHGEFFQTTVSIEDDDESECDQPDSSERSPANIAADFANEFLMHRHRGVINCDSYYVIFGNDGWETDQRSRKEMADVWEKLREHEPESGFSGDRYTWSLVLTDHTRSLFDEDELNQLVWDTWMEVCDELPSRKSVSLVIAIVRHPWIRATGGMGRINGGRCSAVLPLQLLEHKLAGRRDMAKTYIRQEKSKYHIEASEPPVPIVPNVNEANAGGIRFTNFRCWTHGWERLSAQEAHEMTPAEIAGRLLEMGGDESFFSKMPDDSSVRLIQSKTYLLRKNGKEHSEFPTVFETTLGVLRQANRELKRISSET